MSAYRDLAGTPALVSRSQDVAGSAVAAATVRRPAQPVANNCFTGPGTFTATSAGTVRSKHKIAVTCSGIQAVFIGWFVANNDGIGVEGIDTPIPAALTVNAALETADGTVRPFTFGGNALAVVTPGSTLTTDALPVTCKAGDVVYVRTNQPSPAGVYPTVTVTGSGCGGFAAGFNQALAGSGSIPDTSAFWGYGPSALLGVPASSAPGVAVFGDSIAVGLGDSVLEGDFYSEWATGGVQAGGYISRALTAGIGHVNVAHSGEAARGFGNVANRQYRMSLIARLCKYAICELGINDIYFGAATLAQAQSLLIAIWGTLAADGMIVYQTTITPSTSSTDGWTTTANQAPTSNPVCAVIRAQLNDWIRAGAPVVSATGLSPVVVGTGGALLAGQAGHPLAGFFEIAWLAESAHDAATWTVAGVRTVTDGAITSSSVTLTSTSANWTSADIGKAVAVTGAGSGGAILMTSVNSVSGNQATLNDAASTTVSGATVSIGVPTLDGTHPSSQLAARLAAGINTTVLT